MSNAPDLTMAQFQEALQTEQTLLIDFWASWCGPCKAMEPVLNNLMQDPDFKDIKFVKVNVDTEQQLAELFKVTSIPTFFILKTDGQGGYTIVNPDEPPLKRNELLGYMDQFTFKMKALEYLKQA
jgi:thioredoxin 1